MNRPLASIPLHNTKRPRLAITLGDPAGIGSEVMLKALADPSVVQTCDLLVVGSRSLLEKTYHHLLKNGVKAPLADPTELNVLDVGLDEQTETKIVLGTENSDAGAASFAYLETAIAHALAGTVQGIVTAPISKAAWKAAGYDYPGQTELLAERANSERFGMLFVARSPHTGWTLRTLLATTHIPLAEVPSRLSPALMTQKLELLVECLAHDFGISNPRIAIAGLNPHSGEQGKLGTEEQSWLIPWLEQMRDRLPQIQLHGPLPPDTMWVHPGQAWYGAAPASSAPSESNLKFPPSNAADAYLALYHDQGLIPVKLMAFDRAVNTSIGLPFVRTSPDHGTAFDIAGKGIADSTSMKAAIQLAVELCDRQQAKLLASQTSQSGRLAISCITLNSQVDKSTS
ncbi:MAG: 4-hydroxythreonine-4-phosphate dehydrogenase PdxA [Oscillatoriales cyanobacterium C42_A2020_001]|nr:4-hydroxythreonine-4-phosphate dehydrogenase PdxA [Leptolyngbyaceae cyanobacterium C42_A2020_001]